MPKLCARKVARDELATGIHGAMAEQVNAIELTILEDAGNQVRSLASGTYLVGRDFDCDIVINDKTISRKHARLSIVPGAVRIYDLESKNGTFVNGRRLSDASEVKSGDLLCFGNVLSIIREMAGSQQIDGEVHFDETPAVYPHTGTDETRSFNSLDIRVAFQENRKSLHRLVKAFGGLGAILRYEIRTDKDLREYLAKLTSIIQASSLLVVEPGTTDASWQIRAAHGEQLSAESSVLGEYYQMLTQSFDRQEVVWAEPSLKTDQISSGQADFRPAKIAVPITSDGNRLGILLLGGVSFDQGASEADLGLALLGADILAAKLQTLKLHQIEISAMANESRLREIEVHRESIAKAYHLLRDQQEELLQTHKLASLGKLAAGITHELNSPLSVVMSSCKTILAAIEKSSLAAPQDRITETIKSSALSVLVGAERISETIAALKIFALIDKPRISQVDVAASLDATIHLLRSRFPTGINVTTAITGDTSLRCPGREFNIILLAVLENAFHAVTSDGIITVRVMADASEVSVTIVDNGCGIPPETLSKIFDPDFSVKEGRIRLGLGLCSVKRLLLEMNGRISIESTVAKGTAVVLTIPRSPQNNEDACALQ